jgi:hypothetical protein
MAAGEICSPPAAVDKPEIALVRHDTNAVDRSKHFQGVVRRTIVDHDHLIGCVAGGEQDRLDAVEGEASLSVNRDDYRNVGIWVLGRKSSWTRSSAPAQSAASSSSTAAHWSIEGRGHCGYGGDHERNRPGRPPLRARERHGDDDGDHSADCRKDSRRLDVETVVVRQLAVEASPGLLDQHVEDRSRVRRLWVVFLVVFLAAVLSRRRWRRPSRRFSASWRGHTPSMGRRSSELGAIVRC